MEVARPETYIAPVAGPSFGDIAAVSSRKQSVESESEAGIEPQSGYPIPARQEPEITPIPFHNTITIQYIEHLERGYKIVQGR